MITGHPRVVVPSEHARMPSCRDQCRSIVRTHMMRLLTTHEIQPLTRSLNRAESLID
jgi:hypothetical protein